MRLKYKYILAFDPSGSFYEGKGTTGWCLYDATKNEFITVGSVYAKDFICAEEYWNEILEIIKRVNKLFKNIVVVCEDYILYASKLQDQINSRMETCKLIGVLQLYCYMNRIPYYMQLASEVKQRWSDKILEHKRIIKAKGRGWIPTSGDCRTYTHHSLDAIRHAIHYSTFRNKEK